MSIILLVFFVFGLKLDLGIFSGINSVIKNKTKQHMKLSVVVVWG